MTHDPQNTWTSVDRYFRLAGVSYTIEFRRGVKRYDGLAMLLVGAPDAP